MSLLTRSESIEMAVKDLPVEREVEAKNEAAEADMPLPDCLCADHFPELRKAEHDALLTADSNGVVGLVLFIEDIVARPENFRDAGQLHWWELEEFVAMHNWREPVAMNRLARLLMHVLRDELEIRREALRLEGQRRTKGAA